MLLLHQAEFWRVAVAVGILSVVLSGCRSKPADNGSASVAPSASRSSVSVLIVDDDRLGPIIERQWRARTENDIQISQTTADELVSNHFVPLNEVDVVLYPADLIGELASRELVRAIDQKYLNDAEFNRRGLLRFDREELVKWGDETLAVSLGSSLPVLLCRIDVLRELDAEPPKSWQQFSELTSRIRELDPVKSLPNSVLVPTQGHWASHALAIRVASAISSRGNYSSFFDVSSMKPLINSEPFLRALQGWDRDLPDDFERLSPEQVLVAYARGDLAMAVTPVVGLWLDDAGIDSMPDTVIAPLPGTEQRFDESRGWATRDQQEDISVSTVGNHGMLASVTQAANRSRTAVEFLLWIGNKNISNVVSPESHRTGMSRMSHLGNPATWIGPTFSSESARQYAAVVRRANENSVVLRFLRVPGRDRYLQAMDSVVIAVLRGEANAVEALNDLVIQWQNITDELDLETQKSAYRRSEGLTK